MPERGLVPCIIYAARSVADDRRDAEKSTTSQTDEVRARIEEEGGRVVVGEFAESGHSAYHGERGPELEAAMRAAKEAAAEHGVAELWVFHSSRLSRGDGIKGRQGLMKIWADLRYEDVAVRSVSDDESVTNPMLVGIADTQNHKYSRDHGAHVARGKRAALAQGGGWPGGPVPDGYRADRSVNDRGRKVVELVVDPERAAVVELAFDLSEQGLGDPTIARRLNDAGHRTPRGKAYSRRSVQNMLRNPVYAGRVVRWGEGSRKGGTYRRFDVPEVFPGRHPAIIDPDRFDRIDASRAERDNMRDRGKSPADRGRRGGRPTRRYALAKLAVCGRCGERMYASTSPYVRKSDGGQRRRYVCANVKFGTGLCDQPPIDAERVDAAVVDYLDRLFVDVESWAGELEAAADAQRSAVEAALPEARREVERLDAREAKMRAVWTRAIESGDDGRERAAFKVIEETEAQREAAQARADAADRPGPRPLQRAGRRGAWRRRDPRRSEPAPAKRVRGIPARPRRRRHRRGAAHPARARRPERRRGFRAVGPGRGTDRHRRAARRLLGQGGRPGGLHHDRRGGREAACHPAFRD